MILYLTILKWNKFSYVYDGWWSLNAQVKYKVKDEDEEMKQII